MESCMYKPNLKESHSVGKFVKITCVNTSRHPTILLINVGLCRNSLDCFPCIVKDTTLSQDYQSSINKIVETAEFPALLRIQALP